MNKCLNCNSLVANKYCGVSCQNKHTGSLRADIKYGVIKEFRVNCDCCGHEIITNEREKLYPKKKKYFCSRSCANKKPHSQETKDKIKNGVMLTKKNSINLEFCTFCKQEFNKKRKKQHLCSRSCASKWRNTELGIGRKAGLASALSQSKSRRSKNEVYFGQLCEQKFKSVKFNEQLFNGWDADVIIEDLKLAILWNGRWHYEKITKSHSVKQVQNRDEIKIKEIKKCGYVSYVIKDMGKRNFEFVEKEFEKFIDFLKQNNYICV